MSNFQKRTLTTIIGGALVVLLIILGREFLLLTMCAVSVIGMFELTKACGVHDNDKKVNSLEIIGIISTILWYLAIEIKQDNTSVMLAFGFGIIVMAVMAYMAIYVFSFPKYNADQVMAAAFAFVYCPVMISFIYLTRALTYGLSLIWLIFICSWICDICAYLVGVKIGKHKFVPKLSPKKSTEGAIGGIAGSVIIGAVYGRFVLAPQVISKTNLQVTVAVVLIAVVGAMISMIGDLAASAIKRNHDIKDYGKIIPGHGGVMDRFDSVIFTAPMVYALSLLFLQFV